MCQGLCHVLERPRLTVDCQLHHLAVVAAIITAHFTDGASKVTASRPAAPAASELRGPQPMQGVPDGGRGRVSCFLTGDGGGESIFRAF